MAELAVRLWYEEKGQGLAEYALIFVLILLLAITSMKNLAAKADSIYAGAASRITGAYASAQTNSDQVYGSSEGGWSQSGTGNSIHTQTPSANNLPKNGTR